LDGAFTLGLGRNSYLVAQGWEQILAGLGKTLGICFFTQEGAI